MTNSIAYDAIEPVFDELRWTWFDKDGERAWMRYVWGLLAEMGLTAADVEEDRNEVVVRAVALWALTKVFYSKMFDEGHEEDWWYKVGLAVDEPPFIDRSWIEDQVRDQFDLSPDEEEDEDVPEELFNEVLLTLVREAAADIAPQVKKAIGEAGLFAALVLSRSGEATYPLDDQTVAQVIDTNSTWQAVGAYGWVSDDLSI